MPSPHESATITFAEPRLARYAGIDKQTKGDDAIADEDDEHSAERGVEVVCATII